MNTPIPESTTNRPVAGVGLAAFTAVLAACFVLKSLTEVSLIRAAVVVGMFGLLTLPLGYAASAWVLPSSVARHVRVGLAIGLGYALVPVILAFSSRLGVIGLLAPAVLAAAILAARRLRGSTSAATASASAAAPAHAHASTREPILVVTLIGALSVIAITPLMDPLREITSTLWANYAYIDAFFHVNLVQGLMQHAPLADWPSVAGMPPLFYQDYHHLWLATLARLSGVSANDIFFLYAPIVIVLVTVVLAYVVGVSMTRSRVGGYIAAALQYIVLVPNIYDRNLALQDQWVIMLPNFYQIHFYNLRYAQHAASGWILVLAIVLCWSVALRSEDRQTSGRISIAAAFLLAVLFRARPQYFLVMAVPTMVVAAWANRRQPAILLGAAAVGAAALAAVLYPHSTLQTNSSGLVVKYGVFAARVSRAGYYLPDAVTRLLAMLPSPVRSAVGLAAVICLRIVGLNLLLLGLLGARKLWRSSRGPLLSQPELYLWMALASSFAAALLLEQSAVDGNIGWNTLQAGVAPALLLAAAAIVSLCGRARLQSAWSRHPGALLALTVLCTLVAHRGAEALVHERPDRAYTLSTQELDAYAWLHAHAARNAIIAADPRHRVNALGEMIQNTNFLSGMTERSVYAQYLSPLTRPEVDRRIELLKGIYSAADATSACDLIGTTTADYWLEYRDRPFGATSLPCIELVAAGEPNIYRTTKR